MILVFSFSSWRFWCDFPWDLYELFLFFFFFFFLRGEENLKEVEFSVD